MTVARARRTRKGTTSPVKYLPRKVRPGLAVGLLAYDLDLPSALGPTAWRLLERAMLSMDYRTGKLPYPLRWYTRKLPVHYNNVCHAATRLYRLGLLNRYPTPATFPRNWRRYIPLWLRHFMHYDAAYDPAYVAALADLCRTLDAHPTLSRRWARRGGQWYQHLPNLRIHGQDSHATRTLTASDAGFRDLVPPPELTPALDSTRTLKYGVLQKAEEASRPDGQEPRALKPPAPAERTTAPDPSPSTPSTGVLRFAPARGDGDGIPATNSPASGGRGEDQPTQTDRPPAEERTWTLADLAARAALLRHFESDDGAALRSDLQLRCDLVLYHPLPEVLPRLVLASITAALPRTDDDVDFLARLLRAPITAALGCTDEDADFLARHYVERLRDERRRAPHGPPPVPRTILTDATGREWVLDYLTPEG